jgi:DNA-binding NarL/FixJ family response regulator
MTGTQSRIRILCIDDHPLIRDGMMRMLDLEPDMRVVAAGSTGEEALQLFAEHRPDITIMDLNLPRMSGLEAIEALRRKYPSARIVVLTMYRGDEDIRRALEAGAAAYVPKTTVSDDLIRVIRDVHAGTRPRSAEVVTQLAPGRTSRPLTPRELDVLTQLADGLRNKEIAVALGISEDTVEVHVRNIFSKLAVRDRTAAVTAALKRGIIHVGP